MKISVIIPVFNAEKFIRKAVESALDQTETGEILLIDDASPDDSLSICQDLKKKHDRVRLLRHDDLQNHGAGATRNLGIRNAKFDYVAFLDADDFYLKDRFIKARELFESYDDIDGVYEAIGVHFYDPQAERNLPFGRIKPLTTTQVGLKPERLFEALARGKSGFFHLDGLVVKRNLFEHCGYFFDHLKLHQDTAIIIQMSNHGKLIPGQLNKPVAMRGIHDQNRILSDYNAYHTKFLLWQTLFMWALGQKIATSRLIILFHNYCYSLFNLFRESRHSLHANWAPLRSMIHEFLKHPILAAGAFFEYFQRRFYRSFVTD